jgi:hypothetical protein
MTYAVSNAANIIENRNDADRSIHRSHSTVLQSRANVRLAAGKARVPSLVQFFQVSQPEYGQLIFIFLSRGGKRSDVPADFYSGFRDPRLIQGSHRSVGTKNPIHHFTHDGAPQKNYIAIIAVHH